MKNLYKLIGIITFVAVIGFSFTSCSNGTTSGSNTIHVVGTWKATFTLDFTPVAFTLVFYQNMTCIGSIRGNYYNEGHNGTYSISGNTVYISWDDRSSDTLTVNGNTMSVFVNNYGTVNLIKQ
jgi:hypothetical protein